VKRIQTDKPFTGAMDFTIADGIAAIDTRGDHRMPTDTPVLVVPLTPASVRRMGDLLAAAIGAKAAVSAMAVLGIREEV